MKKLIDFIIQNINFILFGLTFIYVYHQIQKRNQQQKVAEKLIEKAVKSGMNEPLTMHPEIDSNLCAGCAACTTVCPEGDILKMVNHKAVLVSPTKCVGHGACEIACPVDAIKLVFGTKTRGMDIPRVSVNYETNVPGLYIAGELGGMGLIRNAIKQGILAGKHAISKLGSSKAQFDLIIIGAGPAGLAASLSAIAAKKSYLCLDQNTLGGAVYHFPRQKIVMTHPFQLPMVGESKFPSNKISKEELLSNWQNIKKKTGLKIKEQTKFESLEKKEDLFYVKTDAGEFTAQKVLLCMGVRGTPRKLGVPGEESLKVTYNLVDPEQYQQKNIIVVGGGNAGVEAAQMLAEARWKNTVHLLVRSSGFDRCNEDNMNRINALEKKGLVKIWFNSSVQEIQKFQAVVKKDEQIITLNNDYVFVFAGAEMPHKFLMSLGIQIDKKFAEALNS